MSREGNSLRACRSFDAVDSRVCPVLKEGQPDILLFAAANACPVSLPLIALHNRPCLSPPHLPQTVRKLCMWIPRSSKSFLPRAPVLAVPRRRSAVTVSRWGSTQLLARLLQLLYQRSTLSHYQIQQVELLCRLQLPRLRHYDASAQEPSLA